MDKLLHNLDNVQYEYLIIETLKTQLGKKVKSVVGSYPEDNKPYPLIVTTLVDSPLQYDASKNEVITRIRLTIELWANSKIETISTLQNIENILNDMNYTRLSKTEIVKDKTNNKFYIKEIFNINFNRMNGNLERDK